MEVKVHQIAELIQADVEGNPDVVISHPAKIEEAGAGAITFFSNPKYESYLYASQASAIIISKHYSLKQPLTATLLRVENVYLALSILFEFMESSKKKRTGISDLAYIHPEAKVPEDCTVGPFTFIDKGVEIGKEAYIGSQVYIGENCKIGNSAFIYAGVKIYKSCTLGNNVVIHTNAVIGSDGFGFVKDKSDKYKKIPQIGNVILEDDVEIGAGTTIDRASMGSTVIREGVKLDNLIQVGHNVVIGKNTVIAAQTGIAGSASIGENNQLGGQVGIAGHLKIGNNNSIAGGSGIMRDVEDNQRMMGYPASDIRNFLKTHSYIQKLGEMEQRLRRIEKNLNIDQ